MYKIIKQLSYIIPSIPVHPGSKECLSALLLFAPFTLSGAYAAASEADIILAESAAAVPVVLSSSDESIVRTVRFSGEVICREDSDTIDFATVYLKDTGYGIQTDESGRWTVEAPEGEYVLVVSAVGYTAAERRVRLVSPVAGRSAETAADTLSFHSRGPSRRDAGRHERVKGTEHKVAEIRPSTFVSVDISPERETIGEAVVTAAGGAGRVRKSAFNTVAVETKSLTNTARSLGDALVKMPGMKLRESGGVGSDMQLMLDGFSGSHIKVFIDGVPQEGAGNSFSINNIPINYAERIEVYKGVVPVTFGTDAIGGVINIVTGRKPRRWFLDASYSYGSFNTHKSYVNFGQTFSNGLMYEVNLFQNYSDNSYWVDTPVEHFNQDGTTTTDNSVIEHVRRFNDTYHNEAGIAKIGLVDRKFADRLVLSLRYARFHKDIQTGVRQEVVFGQKFRKGWSVTPSLEYRKRDLFTKGLDVSLTTAFNDNLTHNVDTSTFRYNWLGEKKYLGGSVGEQSYQNSAFRNTNWNVSFNAEYNIGHAHFFSFSNVLNTFSRKSKSDLTSVITDYTIPKNTIKNIAGLSYRIELSRRWNLSIFGKYYSQYCEGPVSTSSDGVGSYVNTVSRVSTFGYGAAGTWFVVKGLQFKLSYEKAFRLPTVDELFGDEDLEMGSIDLRPENSDNANLNISYTRSFGQHSIYAEGSLIYRDTKDYIMRRTDTQNGGKTYASYENHGRVGTKGFNISLRYSWSHWLSIGGTFTDMDVRNNERYVAGGTLQESLTYKARIPNQPYLFASSDLTFTWKDCIWKGNDLVLSYDNFYMHSFPLYWETVGSASSKKRVPSQFSHNVSLSYSIGDGKYSISLECRNLTDEKLYDNFSLQKAGRAFYGKLRIYLEK